ncbi:SDR family oxidoreductase [Phyllobacterium endophyticum]|uniref:SDR family oxidoreductase n=1 Tax=Phyllobacterium endophyticum TaxID=1149773 RepID=UPI0011CB05CC|nr:SDR family oxidoreductase [Phyllobacterium endophyticum]
MGRLDTRAAIPWISRTLTSELQRRGIRVSAFAPGHIDTDIPLSAGLNVQQVQHVSEQAKQQIPIGRIGRTSDIAQAALFLASNEAAY